MFIKWRLWRPEPTAAFWSAAAQSSAAGGRSSSFFVFFTFIFMKIPICFGQQDGKAILSAALSGVQFIRSDYGNETSFIATTKISEIEVSAPVIHSDVPLET